MFQRTKCVQEESVPGSKNVLRRKVFWRAKYDSARYVQGAKFLSAYKYALLLKNCDD